MFYEAAKQDIYHDTASFINEGVGYHVAGNGPALLLIHGNCTCAALFHKMIVPLTERFTVITVDLPGHGDLKAYTRESVMDPSCCIRHCESVIAHLQLRDFLVCGHDIGGTLALMLAMKKTLDVRGLVLINPNIFPGERCFELVRMNAFPNSETDVCLDVFWRYAQGSGVEWSSYVDLRGRLGEVDVPVLELASESEPQSEALYEAWCKQSRACVDGMDWTIRRIMGSGWFAPLEKPAQLAAYIEDFAAGIIGR